MEMNYILIYERVNPLGMCKVNKKNPNHSHLYHAYHSHTSEIHQNQPIQAIIKQSVTRIEEEIIKRQNEKFS